MYKALLAGFSLLFLSGAANAQEGQSCASRSVVVDHLSDTFKEVQAARGKVNDTTIMELFVSPDGSWTIINTNSQGRSCIAQGGTEGFEFVAPEVPKSRRRGRGHEQRKTGLLVPDNQCRHLLALVDPHRKCFLGPDRWQASLTGTAPLV